MKAELEQARNYIYKWDLNSTFNRLVLIHNWHKQDAKEAIQQYRNYLFLRKKYQEEKMS